MKLKVEEIRKIIAECYLELDEVFGIYLYCDKEDLYKLEEETDEEFYDRMKKFAVNMLNVVNSHYREFGMDSTWVKNQLDRVNA